MSVTRGSLLFNGLIAKIDNYAVPGVDEPKIALNPEAKALLYKGAEEKDQTKSARIRFLLYLEENYQKLQAKYPKKDPDTVHPQNSAITLKELLGKEGVELYEAAIKEESKSRNFRDQVFKNSVFTVTGQPASEDKKIVAWIGGPSGTGKSFYSKNFANRLVGHDDHNDNHQEVSFVTIDGGIERQTSQMRNLVLNLSLKHGYSGVVDLEDHTELHAKKHIQEAALESKKSEGSNNYNLVIPATFVSDILTVDKTMKTYANDENIQQVFCEIGAPEGQDKPLKTLIEYRAEKRAFGFPNASTKQALVTESGTLSMEYNGQVESKPYSGFLSYEMGKNCSERAKEKYISATTKSGQEPECLKIENNSQLTLDRKTGKKVIQNGDSKPEIKNGNPQKPNRSKEKQSVPPAGSLLYARRLFNSPRDAVISSTTNTHGHQKPPTRKPSLKP